MSDKIKCEECGILLTEEESQKVFGADGRELCVCPYCAEDKYRDGGADWLHLQVCSHLLATADLLRH